MPRAYLLSICSGSSVDRELNNVSLFNLVEQVAVPGFQPGMSLPLELHAYWEAGAGELGADYECRFVLLRGDEVSGQPSPPIRFRQDSPRVRARALGLPIPATGAHRLGVEWRRLGEDAWRREATLWPIHFDAAPIAPVAG
jgi:hypothetical protein